MTTGDVLAEKAPGDQAVGRYMERIAELEERLAGNESRAVLAERMAKAANAALAETIEAQRAMIAKLEAARTESEAAARDSAADAAARRLEAELLRADMVAAALRVEEAHRINRELQDRLSAEREAAADLDAGRQATIDNLAQRLRQAEAETGEVRTLHQTDGARIRDLQAQIGRLEAAMEQRTAEMAAATADRIMAIEAAMQTSLATLRADAEAQAEEAAAQIEEANAQIVVLQSEIVAGLASLSAADEQNEELTRSLARQLVLAAELDERLAAIEEDAAARPVLEAELAELKAAHDSLRFDYEDVRRELLRAMSIEQPGPRLRP